MKLSNQSKRPKQVPPIQRPSTSSTLSNENGVAASFAGNLFNFLKYYNP